MEKLPTWRKWIYGSGDLGFSLTSTIVGAYFAIFLTDVVGISAGVAAAALFIGKTWDYINDPLFGYITDRTRTRWGRRRPYLLFGPIPLAVVFIMLWWRPPLQGNVALAIYYAIAFIIYDAVVTTVYMPFIALTPELTADYDDRTSLNSVRAFFSIFASLLAFTIPLMIVDGFSPEHAGKVLWMAVIFGSVSAIPLFLVFFGTRERPEFMHQQKTGLIEALKASTQNRPFIFSAVIYLFTWVSVDILQTIMLYFIKYVLKREGNSDVIMATIFVVGIAALPLWTWVSRRLNKRKAYILGSAFFAAVLLVLINVTPTTPLTLILILCILAGIGVSAAHMIPWSIIPDAIEYGELKTGKRYEGTFYSLISLAQKIASSFAIPLALLMLDKMGYVPNSLTQPRSAVLGIQLLTGPFPALMMCIGILFAIIYPLERERYTQIAHQLEERRASSSEEVV